MRSIDQTPERGRARPHARSLPVLCGAALAALTVGAASAEPPPHGKPGECYARVVKPAVYGTQSREVVDSPAWSETRVVPAVTEKLVRQVVVKPEVIEKTWREPVYREDVRWVTVPGETRLVQEPARYETVREKVLVEPGRYEWRLTAAPLAQGPVYPGQTLVYATGEVYCKVWVEPRYSVVERTVEVAPARTVEAEGPPRQEKVIDKVLVSEGGWTERREPAVYSTEVEEKVVHSATTEVISHPATYRTVTEPLLIAPEHEDWAPVGCAKDVAPEPRGERG